ncbi:MULTISPECIES: hypothetical protein [Catenuloplanes]|uniref:Uncharacterized protein n=1 Tax=Catenuloplanes niger TaxID=587534 RepID=A0AAE4CUB9_9ACTN|nr:hypothetical protein [Catenuloplanes niger]MDR7323233.1 hypothetical protein [Catenuloplanes niger]
MTGPTPAAPPDLAAWLTSATLRSVADPPRRSAVFDAAIAARRGTAFCEGDSHRDMRADEEFVEALAGTRDTIGKATA